MVLSLLAFQGEEGKEIIELASIIQISYQEGVACEGTQVEKESGATVVEVRAGLGSSGIRRSKRRQCGSSGKAAGRRPRGVRRI